MEYREIGRTGEKVSVIGMGTWRIGAYHSPDERASQVQALRRGIDIGMNLIDTAEIYASGRSEEVVGEAIRAVREDVFIATKVSSENLHYDDVLAACERSLRRLGTSYIDLYQVHWPNPSIPIEETMRAMEELVRSGKVKYIGVSNFSVMQTEAAQAAMSREEIVSNQVEYSISHQLVEADILPYCAREKLTLIAYSPLDKGNISSMRVPKAILEKYGVTPPQAALNWVTRHREVVAIPKATNMQHLEENASSVVVRYSESEYQQMSKVSDSTL